MFLHLDGFSAIKDSIEHAGADLLLTQAARRLRTTLAPQHTLARWGGDEFAALVRARSATEPVEVAEQLGPCITAQPFPACCAVSPTPCAVSVMAPRACGQYVAATASVGVAFAGDSPAGDFLRNAAVAMTRAKASGGGRVEIFAAHTHADIASGRALTSELERAIVSGA